MQKEKVARLVDAAREEEKSRERNTCKYPKYMDSRAEATKNLMFFRQED